VRSERKSGPQFLGIFHCSGRGQGKGGEEGDESTRPVVKQLCNRRVGGRLKSLRNVPDYGKKTEGLEKGGGESNSFDIPEKSKSSIQRSCMAGEEGGVKLMLHQKERDE